ncbi:MAG: hypothetical protein JWN43_1540 [Gammaproteobacteria bacterium]|nr:hypothetical protein [Gammaproteobacteria bacterium]
MFVQKIVIELVDLPPIVDDPAVLGANGSKDIVKDGVKPEVTKAELVRDELELGLTVIADQCPRKIRSDRQIEEAIGWT